MKNLNEKQQAIIDNLINEFKRLNEPTPKGSLINIGEIKKEYDEQKNRIIEIKQAKKELDNLINEVALKDCYTLNKDLKELGLVANQPNKYRIKITKADGHVCYSKELNIEINPIHTHIEKVLNNNVNVYEGYQYLFKNKPYNTLEDVVKSENFKDCLKQLFYEIKK